MTKLNLDNIIIVASQPMFSGNIGSVARAMANMGLARLRVVAPQADLGSEDALKMACDGRGVLETAQRFATLREAVADVPLVVGTTRRVGVVRQHVMTPRTLAERITDLSQTARIAVVFGNEGSGLSNEEIAVCQWLVTIPTDAGYKSLNLSQAVMVVAYELFMAQTDHPPEPVLDIAPTEALETMYEALRAALLSIGFLDPINPERLMFALRRFLGRAKLENRDVKILRGIARQINWFVRVSGGPRPK